ncbi:hypothetical protein, partial [Peribacillus frigoritolerans]|uniref:hypothetical protein n=1 Tax=Peribacillus frigoritolerans TaxID=450367 RepID=UPI002E1A137F|nr:hypothetical protein [Peribacillus frigoritolerans]
FIGSDQKLKFACSFFIKKFPLISEIRSLSVDCLPSSSTQASVGSRLASNSAGVSQISSIH